MNEALISNIKTNFITKFQGNPVMIFSPGRINIIGEHTDYNDGFVFPAAVDKGIVAGLSKSNSGISTAYAVDKEEI
ncbi:MAG: galactokinase family protein, partial [Lutibacter sp.]